MVRYHDVRCLRVVGIGRQNHRRSERPGFTSGAGLTNTVVTTGGSRFTSFGYKGASVALGVYMKTDIWAFGMFLAVTVSAANGQTVQRRATAVGGGSPDRGSCRIEVLVDGAAEVNIRGDAATLRNLGGQAPQWRRFECTSPMPANPSSFRFTGVDGRGSQELVRGPQSGGVAVVRIQDPEGGASGYAFELTWGDGDRQNHSNASDRGYSGEGRGDYQRQPPSPDGGPDGRDGPDRQRFTTEQAARVCQDAVRQQASNRFQNANIAFRTTRLDNNPGREDWVTGLLDVRRGYERDETYRFSCSVDFDSGEVRSAQLDPIEHGSYMPGYGDARASSGKAAMESCEKSVEDSIRQKGYQHVDFLSINVDDRPGRINSVVGTARADVRSRSDSFRFSCAVDLRDGDVQGIDVRRY